ncbi:hypothetical protein GCM10023194_36190 [Planotetraspora phitsanulokensis]|uniref:Uncharacterized protein n=1 Tax=Planotetraspora phitsanulokensis TaxID=575192 RepID=A0A8J3U0K0_9ACTN|nr:hypothetical protein [Planotetraspora phitsanulokensis]GII36253.1 hypothetical protein Pph01_12560 [Planotetraspora phitsanulokensis]
MNVTCAVCGQVNAEGTQFCVNPACGAYLPWDRTAAHHQPPQEPPPPVPHPPPSESQPRTARHERVEPEHRPGARIELADAALAVDPGQIAETQVTVHNTGNRVERFLVRVSGPAAPWASVDPADITVYPGRPAVCTVRFAPSRQAATSAGTWNFGVLADSQVTPGLQASVVGAVHLGDYRSLTMTLEPGAARGGSRTTQTLLIDNQGNVPERLRLTASDTDGLLRFELPGEATVEPGRSAVPLQVHARQKWFGRPQRVPFHVVATPEEGRPVGADGVRIVRPRLGVLPLVLAGALAAVLAGGVALNLGSSTDSADSGSGPIGVAGSPSQEAVSPAPGVTMRPPESPSPTPTPSPSPSPSPRVKSPAPPPVDPASKLLVEYRRSGGFAGFADRITVFGDGRATVTRVTTNVDTTLTPDELAALNEKLEVLELGEPAAEPGGADHITYELLVNGRRSVRYDVLPPDWQDVTAILDQVIERQ